MNKVRSYYNEFDKQKAAWLRELIARNLIAPGDVDERSIHDVRPDDLRGYRQCHFFAGIGIWSYALRLAGWPDDREVWTGSCPCQPFSAAGKQEGFNDERHLWPEWFRLIQSCCPPVIFGEQVASASVIGYQAMQGLSDYQVAELLSQTQSGWVSGYLSSLREQVGTNKKAVGFGQQAPISAGCSKQAKRPESDGRRKTTGKGEGITVLAGLAEYSGDDRRGNMRNGLLSRSRERNDSRDLEN